jgi:TonB family protein
MHLSVTPAGYFTVLLFSALLSVRVRAQTSELAPVPDPNLGPVFKVGGSVSAPRPIYMPDPEYSEEARKANRQGSCVLRLVVGPDGNPSGVSVERSLGMGLDEKAIDAVRSWRFEPARKDGKPVAVQIHVEVSFRLYKHGTKLYSPELLKRAAEDRARAQALIYKDPEGHSPRVCRQSAFVDKERVSSPQVAVAQLSFEGNLQMPAADQAQISISIRQQAYSGNRDEVIYQVQEKSRAAWQEHGYFDVRVQGDAKVLSEQIAAMVHVDEGPQYRLERIVFKNVKEVRNVGALRSLFPIKDGDIFNSTLIKQGLDNLRNAYLELGHLNFTSIPNTAVGEEGRSILLDVDIDEGKKFFVSRIDIMGLDEPVFQNARQDLLVKPGNVYDQRLVKLFLQNHASLLPANVPPDSSIDLRLDEEAGTVALTYDFRPCGDE